MQSALLTVHHNNFVADSTELYSVADLQFVALAGLEVVVLVVAHVAHDEPQFVTRVGLLVLGIVDFEAVIEPVVVVLEETRSCYFLSVVLLFQPLVVQRRRSEVIECLLNYCVVSSSKHNCGIERI